MLKTTRYSCSVLLSALNVIAMKTKKFALKCYLIPLLLVVSIFCTAMYFVAAFSFPYIVQIGKDYPAFKIANTIRSFNQHLMIKLRSQTNPVEQISRVNMVRKENRFPACIIFGVSKAGTRAACEYLKLHPDIVAPIAEIQFFDNLTLQVEKGTAWYLQQMPESKPNQITVEKSPDYFQHPNSASLIYNANPSTKLLLLLRDPVERLISQYMQLLEKNPSLPAFEDWVIDPISGNINVKQQSVLVSAYSRYLVQWLDIFPREQIHIIESGSLRVNPLAEMKQVEQFLNVRPYFTSADFYFNATRGFYCPKMRGSGEIKCLGKSKGRDHITVEPDILEKLKEFYLPYNEELSKLLDQEFLWS